jgi:hypothetical protein
VLTDAISLFHTAHVPSRTQDLPKYVLRTPTRFSRPYRPQNRPSLSRSGSEASGRAAEAGSHQPNKPPPPAPPFLPPLRASVSSHSRKKSLFFISSGLTSLVSNCASCLLKASNVGMLVMRYVIGKSLINVLSISTSTNPKPPSRSPTRSSSMSSLTRGLTAWHVWHQLALQNVMSARLSAALSMVRVCRSCGWRTLSKRRFVFERLFAEGKREKARACGRERRKVRAVFDSKCAIVSQTVVNVIEV